MCKRRRSLLRARLPDAVEVEFADLVLELLRVAVPPRVTQLSGEGPQTFGVGNVRSRVVSVRDEDAVELPRFERSIGREGGPPGSEPPPLPGMVSISRPFVFRVVLESRIAWQGVSHGDDSSVEADVGEQGPGEFFEVILDLIVPAKETLCARVTL